MKKGFLDDILGNKSSVRILRVLARDRAEMTGRELARRAGISAASAHAAAKRLSYRGLVRLRSVGTGIVCALNESHYLVVQAGLGRLLSEEENYAGTAAFELAKSLNKNWIESVVLFGSVARGEAKPQSDVDVLLLLKDRRRVQAVKRSLLENSLKISDRFGVRLSPYVIGIGEFVDRYDRADLLIRNMVRDGKRVSGKSLSEVLVDERS